MQCASDPLDAEPGQQTLVPIENMSSVVDHLPLTAFDNLLIVSPNAPSRVERAIKRRGGDPSKCGMIPITGSKTEYEGPLWTSSPVSPSDLTGLSMRYSRAMQHVSSENGWFCFDNLQLLLMYADERDVHRLLSEMANRTRGRDVRGVYSVARDAVSDDTYEQLVSVFDDVIDRRSE